MPLWTPDEIPWDQFDAGKVDPNLVCIVKAAGLVEQNGSDYARYLCNVFDDSAFHEVARQWAAEEIQHGQVLGRWAALADPGYDHAAASARFTAGYRVDLSAKKSVRGSLSGELLARCIVEVGTSSYYAALGEATNEPVLKEICRRIEADELRHYKLFYTHLKRHLTADGLGLWRRLRVALGRILESEDDELAYAYFAANENTAPFERVRYNRAYVRRAYSVYRRHHVERGVAMIFKVVGLKPQSRLNRMAASLAWWIMHRRAERLARQVA